MSNISRVLMVGLASFLFTACAPASPRDESAGQYIDSAAITTRVKASLVDSLGSNGFAIQVKTYKDQVQLSGFVNSQQIKQKAGALAADVAGVRGVSNAILVKTR